MESIKNRERKSNRFVMCFKPVDMEDGGSVVKTVSKIGDTGNPMFAYNADSIGNNKDSITPVLSSVLSDEGVNVSDEVVVRKMKKPKFSRILKAVLFETSLTKKRKNKKWRKNSFPSSSNLSTNSEKSSNSVHENSWLDEGSDNRRTNSNISSSRNCTITSAMTTTLGPSIVSTSGSISERKALFRSNSMKLKQREDGWNHGLCLLLVSLLVLVLWGKVCAIFCTSTWLFFVPRRSIGQGSPGIGVGLPEFDSVEYKKRVIMGGLLGRDRSRSSSYIRQK